jgi:outer membrane protein TolC
MARPTLFAGIVAVVGLAMSLPVAGQQDWSTFPDDVSGPPQAAVSMVQPRSPLRKPVTQDIESVLRELDEEAADERDQPFEPGDNWWTEQVQEPIDSSAQSVAVNVGDLILMALDYSAKVRVARALPEIRETAIAEARSAFDWNQFIDARWVDTSEPVGNVLTVGGGGTRFRDHNFSMDAGLRRKLFNGGDFYSYQRLGHQNNNSSFFDPQDQATSRIVLGFTQPLLRGRGTAYNTSLILLAEIDTGSANDEYHRQLQTHLLEVARGYWALYLERTNLAQRVRLYLNTRAIAEELKSRAAIDAQQTQVISANAALEARKSDLVRTRAAVKNAETRLRALINAPGLSGDAENLELVPFEHPVTLRYPADTAGEFEIALHNRPEVAAAMKAIRAACVRLRMADHEILPALNLVTEAYVSGLRGDSDIGNAWVDQFRLGEPSYSFGLEWEVPLGRRAARANRRRRQIEVRQLEEQYRATLELVRAEVEVAVREMKTAFLELDAKNRSREAANAEAATLKVRWEELGDQGSTGALVLESLLRAQERVTQAEFEFAKAQLTYSLSLINLRHANGTLFQIAGTGALTVPTTPFPSESLPAPEMAPARSPADAAANPFPNRWLTPRQTVTTDGSQADRSVSGRDQYPIASEDLPKNPSQHEGPLGISWKELINSPPASEAELPVLDGSKSLR